MLSEKEKMIKGLDYNPLDKELSDRRYYISKKVMEINTNLDREKSTRITKTLFEKSGKNFFITPPIFLEYGFNIKVGENFYTNFNCTLLDICPITIGDNCMIAPNVQIYTATHSTNPVVRNSGKEFGKPVTIGDNVWIGGGAIILPGVTLGDNVVVAAGAVVTKDFSKNVVIGGNPARIIKEID